MLERFLRNESGATAIEYSVVAGIISLAIIGGMNLLADQVGVFFNNIDESVTQALN